MHNTKTPLAVAVYMEILYILCVIVTWLVPNTIRAIGASWIHGFDLSALPINSLTAGNIIIGVISSFVVTYILVWLFVIIYKAIAK